MHFGGWSKRNSCRFHTYVEGEHLCVDCFSDKEGVNCYHKPQLSCIKRLIKWLKFI